MDKNKMQELHKEFTGHLATMNRYFNEVFAGSETFYPLTTAWFDKVTKNENTPKVKTFFKENELTSNNPFYDAYFFMIIKSESYLFEFADMGLTDLKNFIKEHYKECLNGQAFAGLSQIFGLRKEILDKQFLQEYTGKNRARETLKKEGKFVKDDIYYLNPLIDDLYELHGYDKMDFGSLVGTRIINIRGTNGSGKTTMMKRIIAELNKKEESVWDEFRTMEITTYHKEYTRKVEVWHEQKFVVMGIYNDKQTGGVDNYDTPWQVMYALLLFAKKYKGYTILFEGVRISTDYKYWHKMFSILVSVGVKVDIIGLIPSDVNWALNNVIERRKNKGLWELRNPQEIANNNYDILRGLLLFLSEGFNPLVISGDKIGSVEDTFEAIRMFINLGIPGQQ